MACTTYLVQPGFFDIFFPTDFHLLRDLYSLVMAPSPSNTKSAASVSPSTSSSSVRIGTDFFSPHTARRAGNSGLPLRGLKVLEHGEFLDRWGETEMTRCKDGTNPMIQFYLNAQFIC